MSPLVHEFGGVPITQLAERFGTPLYIYDASIIGQRIAELRSFDVIRYAQKACSNIAVLAWMRRHGVVVDAVSAGEIHRALAAGYRANPQLDPPEIVYTADLFDQEALQLVRQLGIHCNVGSPDMIDQLGADTPGGRLTLRINPGFGHGHSQKTNTGGPQSKHGIWHGDVDDCLQRAGRYGIDVEGVHMHIGSGTDIEHLSQVCAAMETIVRQIGPSVRTISAGGGLPIRYRDEDELVDLSAYYARWDDTRRRLQDQLGHALRLEIEPGRYLVAESGCLITEIRAIKMMGENRFYLVDAGFNNLARPILYGAYHPMAIAPVVGRDAARPLQSVVVGGPLCESGDIFTQQDGGYVCQRPLPTASVGDLLVIFCTGAYGSVMASNYNSKPLAPEVLIVDQIPHLIRRRQSLEQLIVDESIPESM